MVNRQIIVHSLPGKGCRRFRTLVLLNVYVKQRYRFQKYFDIKHFHPSIINLFRITTFEHVWIVTGDFELLRASLL